MFASGEDGDRIGHGVFLDQFEVRSQKGVERVAFDSERRAFRRRAEEEETGEERARAQQRGHARRVIRPAIRRQRAKERTLVDPVDGERWLVSKEIRLFDDVRSGPSSTRAAATALGEKSIARTGQPALASQSASYALPQPGISTLRGVSVAANARNASGTPAWSQGVNW